MIKVALMDGVVSKDERAILESFANAHGIEINDLDRHLSEFNNSENLPLLPDGSVDISSYCGRESSLYDSERVVGEISLLTVDDVKIKWFRNAYLKILSVNADKFKELAKWYDRQYKDSDDQTEWAELIENRDKWLSANARKRKEIDHVSSLSRGELISYCKDLYKLYREPSEWD